METTVIVTLIISVLSILLGVILRKTKYLDVTKFMLYELSDEAGYRNYLGRNCISAGAWLIVGVILAQFFHKIDILKLDLLTLLFLALEYKLSAGKYMEYDKETGMIKKKYEKK